MRTSQSQFIVLVEYMEKHGDLSRLPYTAAGRINLIKHWEELTKLLNSDVTGDSKSSEKWKKVWSDYKNNTKKKVARIHKATTTGIGPVRQIFSHITDLEQRVLNIINREQSPHAVEGEPEFTQEVKIEPCEVKTLDENEAPSQIRILDPLEVEQSTEIWNEPGSSQACISPKLSSPDSSGPSSPIVHLEADTIMQSLEHLPSPQFSNQSGVQQPYPQSEQATSWRDEKPTRLQAIKKKVKPKYTEQTAMHFVQSDKEWRKFKMQQHRDFIELKREQNRIKELEIQSRKEWQAIGIRAVDLLSQIVNKYCKD